jgi:hypothetical protein
MGSVIKLAAPAVSQETKTKIVALLREIEQGNVVGVAFVALQPGHEFYADAAGTAKDHPAVARGALQSLNDILGTLVGST